METPLCRFFLTAEELKLGESATFTVSKLLFVRGGREVGMFPHSSSLIATNYIPNKPGEESAQSPDAHYSQQQCAGSPGPWQAASHNVLCTRTQQRS